MNLYSVSALVSSLVCMLLGLYVVKQNPRNLVNLTFGVGALFVCIMEFGVYMAQRAVYSLGAMFWAKVGLAGACLIPPSLVIFSLTFARDDYREHLRRWKWPLIGMCIASIGALALVPTDLLIQRVKASLYGYTIFLGRIGGYLAIYILLTIVAALFSMESTFRQAKGMKRMESRFMIFGLVGALVLHLYILGIALLFHSIETSLLGAGSLGIVFGCVLSAYSIVRYKLLDSRIIIGRQVAYSSLTFLLTGVFLLLMGLFGSFLQRIGGRHTSLIITASAFWAIFLAFTLFTAEGIRGKIKAFVDRNFYKYIHDYRREWVEFGKRTSSIINLDGLLDVIVDFVSEGMKTPKILIMLLDEDSGRFTVAKSRDLPEVKSVVDQNSRLVNVLQEAKSPLEVKGISDDMLSGVFPSGNGQEVEILAPLMIKEELIGILALGGRNHKDKLTGDDLVFLGTIADQASVAINNAKLSEELISSRELESFHKLSSFIIHDLRNSVSTLSILVNNAADNFGDPEFRKDALKTVSDTISKMKDLMFKISAVPGRLELNLRACDVNSIVRKVISRAAVNGKGGLAIKTDLGDLPAIRADQNQVEKVVFNLVLNAIESLGGTGEVRVSTFEDSDFVNIQVADTGRGMSPDFLEKRLFKPFQTTKEKGLGIGLYQVKTIVDAHKGEVKVKSKEGEGTTFEVRLPKHI